MYVHVFKLIAKKIHNARLDKWITFGVAYSIH